MECWYDLKGETMILRFCVWYLTRQIKKDKGLFIAYQSNIAMCMFDVFKPLYRTNKARRNLHSMVNTGAYNFIRLWIA